MTETINSGDSAGINELRQSIAQDLRSQVPANWSRIDLRFWAAGAMTQYDLNVIEQTGEIKPVPVPLFAAANLLRDLRAAMYEPGRGTWFSMRFTMDGPAKYRFLFNYDDDPLWSPEIASSNWIEDLGMYPRETENIPEWLRLKVGK